MAMKPAPTGGAMHGRTWVGPTAGRNIGESLQTRNGARTSQAITRGCGPQVGDVVVVNEPKRGRADGQASSLGAASSAPTEELRFGRRFPQVPEDLRRMASGPCRWRMFGDRAIPSPWRAGAFA